MRIACLLLAITGCLLYKSAKAQPTAYQKVLFVNSIMPGSFYYSHVTYKTPSWVGNVQQQLPVSAMLFFTPGNSLQLSFVSAAGGQWQATIRNHDIRGVDTFFSATHLLLKLYISSSTLPAELPAITITTKDSQQIITAPLQQYITNYQRNTWLSVAIPLAVFKGTITPDNIAGIKFMQQASDGKEHMLYIDDVELGNSTAAPIKMAPLLTSAKAYDRHVDITWPLITDTAVKYVKIYRSNNGKTFYPVGIQTTRIHRYADFVDTTNKTFYYKISFLNKAYSETPFSNTIQATTHSLTDEQLLDMVQEAHFRYYWEGAESGSGLALENIPGRPHMVAAGASGFGIMATIVAAQRQFITRQQLTNRFLQITNYLLNAETFHGAFPHFMDGISGRVVPFFGQKDNGGDLVETAFLLQGLLAAQQYFTQPAATDKLIHNRIDSIWRRVEWIWYRREPTSDYLFWHWSPDKAWVINHRLIGWNETLITYLLAIASPTHSVPASMYYSGWASQSPYAADYRTWGQSPDGLKYTNGNTYYGVPLAVGVSNGGPLFFTHYSYMGFDPHALTDAYANHFVNNQHIARINYRYCQQNPAGHKGYATGAWGLTASDGPNNYSADQPDTNADRGKITPTGALASFPYTPTESMAALKHYYYDCGKFLWGEYGFRDAYLPDSNWCSEGFVGLNQAPITVMIENYRTGGIWKLFMQNKNIQAALQKLATEKPVQK